MIRIFISSVQSEFAAERRSLAAFLRSDALLGKFFDPFIFEELPATDGWAEKVYLDEVRRSDIYIGLIGQQYGHEDKEGVSPTEREFDYATLQHKVRYIFLTPHKSSERHPKSSAFRKKVDTSVVRKIFRGQTDLLQQVYHSLVRYLEEKGYIQTAPFDAMLHRKATFEHIDLEKVKAFVRTARARRGLPLDKNTSPEEVLLHLNLLEDGKLTNSALLLFAKDPQRFFITSEVKCASFHGNTMAKPIPSYKVFRGDVFSLVDQAIEFVMAKLDYRVETRNQSAQVSGSYEIPREVVAEAIINSVAHRDYTSNASIQVMLFRNRLEITNPGTLPLGWTTERLKTLHNSIPHNPLLAHPMYLAGYIERLGTGTSDMVERAVAAGLPEPEFKQDDQFSVIIYRTSTMEATTQATMEATTQATMELQRVLLVLEGEMKRLELQHALNLKNVEHFRKYYIAPALDKGYIEMKYPNMPKHPQQRYRLTVKGLTLKQKLKSN